LQSQSTPTPQECVVNYLIPQELLTGVLQYLAARPYAEVAQAIEALRQLQPAEKPELIKE